jgi:hypothetical protein
MADSSLDEVFEPVEAVLPPRELLQIDSRTALFVRVDTGRPPSLEDRQEALSAIRLKQSVPESVRLTFRLAKRLYLFGHFEYGFYTISQHYAFLALEAAVYSRWVSDLPPEITIQVPPNPLHKTPRTTHEKLYSLWQKCGRKLKVEGQDFPNSVFKILAKFVSDGTITENQRERIEAAIQLRNELSHLESAPIDSPSLSTLEITSEFINTLYGGR